MSPSLFVPYLVAFVFLLLLLEQLSYLRKKQRVPGPTLFLPLLGNSIPLVKNPTKFWDDQSSAARPLGFSVNYFLGRFIVFIRDTELSLKVFNNVRPDAFHLVGHPFGKKLFGEHNLIYMFGQEHKDLRARIAPNFTPNALAAYTSIQHPIILEHFRKWARIPQPVSLRLLIRDLNLETSQMVFVGPYLSPKERALFCADYNNFNLGLMALPVDLPGFAFRRARLSVLQLVNTLSECSRRSKASMRSPNPNPQCLIDFWMQELVKEIDSSSETIPNSSDRDIGSFLFDFLFAAQDASTSSLLWAVSLLESHPDILDRVREEVSRVWPIEIGKPPSLDDLREMKFTHAVAREVIRVRAPATLVPHVAMQEFPLTDDFVVPKGAIVFPSVFESCFQGFSDPTRFDPDRFDSDRREDQVYKKNFLAFGAGPHQCVGQRYALNHLVLFIAMFVSAFDFTRVRADGCDDIVYNPTICPKDGCTVTLSKRGEWAI